MLLLPTDVVGVSDDLMTAPGLLRLPAGGGRFMRAQQAAATRAGETFLFGRGGRLMSPASLMFGWIIAFNEADFFATA